MRADLSRHNVARSDRDNTPPRLRLPEARGLLRGKLPDGTEFPLYGFEEFRRGIAALPWRYGVVLEFETAKASATGYVPFEAIAR